MSGKDFQSNRAFTLAAISEGRMWSVFTIYTKVPTTQHVVIYLQWYVTA